MSGAFLRPVVCAWCGGKKAPVACEAHEVDKISDGMCLACQAWMLADLDATVREIDEASSLAGQPLRETGIAASAARREHALGTPASSLHFNEVPHLQLGGSV